MPEGVDRLTPVVRSRRSRATVPGDVLHVSRGPCKTLCKILQRRGKRLHTEVTDLRDPRRTAPGNEATNTVSGTHG
ncbi:hypothetical protein GCM10009584_02660 [Ornithinimicrobium humiphilum]